MDLVKRGEIWLVTLDPTIGSEIQKTRPCLIVAPNEMNKVLRRTIIAPITSGSHPAPFRVPLTFRQRPGLILLDQIRTVDRARLLKRMGEAEASTLRDALTVLQQIFAG